MYRRLDRLARNASTMTLSMVKPAFRHLGQNERCVSDCLTSHCHKPVTSYTLCVYALWKCVSPADVIDGDVPELFIHGGLAPLALVGAEC